jgi:diacylglycerol kinase family enzyme
MRLLLIHNPKAGYEQAGADEIRAMLAAAGHDVTYQSSEIDDLAGPINHDWELIVVAGGDGTVSRVVKLCADKPIPLAILPLGTANNIANVLGHQGTLEDLIKSWEPGVVRRVDVGVAVGDWGRSRFAESFGVGLLAETIVVADKGNEEKARAKFKTVAERLKASMKTLHKRLRDLEPVEVTLKTPEQTHSGKFLWAEVTPIGSVGPRLPILETDDPADGLLAFALLPVEERDTFDQYIEHRQDMTAPRRTGLVTGRAPRISLTWSAGAAHLDGKLLPKPPGDQLAPRTAELETLPGAVRVLRLAR